MPTQEVSCGWRPGELLAATGLGEHAVLLDGAGSHSWGDGDALFAAAPVATLEVFSSGWGRWRCRGRTLWQCDDPLAQWQRLLDDAPGLLGEGADPAGAGCLTVLDYDLKHWLERLPRRQLWPDRPVLFAALYDSFLRFDYRSGRLELAGTTPQALAHGRQRVEAPAIPERPREPAGRVTVRAIPGCDGYVRMVDRAREYIAAGDIYQVNLARRFDVDGAGVDAAGLFAQMQEKYPMPFGAYVDGGDWAAVSVSPECLLDVDGAEVRTFPIKGTAGRGPAALREDPKERAEHVMIVDLERNDLGRVCEPGSVEVRDFAAVHAFPLLHHMVSEVRGTLRPHTKLADLVRAVFPGGSITGAPKVRAMEVIEELEPSPRGLYTGAIGWTTLAGRSRFNIAIRTAVARGGRLTYFAGGGIVIDSDPQREYEETMLKSEAFFRCVGGTVEWR